MIDCLACGVVPESSGPVAARPAAVSGGATALFDNAPRHAPIDQCDERSAGVDGGTPDAKPFAKASLRHSPCISLADYDDQHARRLADTGAPRALQQLARQRAGLRDLRPARLLIRIDTECSPQSESGPPRAQGSPDRAARVTMRSSRCRFVGRTRTGWLRRVAALPRDATRSGIAAGSMPVMCRQVR